MTTLDLTWLNLDSWHNLRDHKHFHSSLQGKRSWIHDLTHDGEEKEEEEGKYRRQRPSLSPSPSPSPSPSFTADNTGESQKKKKGSLWSCLLLLLLLLLLLHNHHHYHYHRHHLLLYQTLKKSWSYGFLRSTPRCSIFPQLIRSMRVLFSAFFALTQSNLAASSAPFASQLHLL